MKKFIVTAFVTLVALETALWLFPTPDPYPPPPRRFHRHLAVWNAWEWKSALRTPPPFSKPFDFGPLHGVEPGERMVTVNKFGFLYPPEQHERSSTDEIRVAIIGGSTVECLPLRPERRISGVLERFLEEQYPDRPVSVLNLGVFGEATPTHLSTVAQHAVKLDLDAIVFVLGANDLHRIAPGWRMFNDAKSFLKINFPGSVRYTATRLQLVRRVRLLVRQIRNAREGTVPHPPDPAPYFALAAAQLAALPALPFEPEFRDETLVDYERNILSLAVLAHAHNVEVLFATQPMLWKQSPTPEEEAVNWMGMIKHNGQSYRLTPGQSARLLETLNGQLIDACERYEIDYMDLADAVPRTLDAFYDHLHYNENGARIVGEAIGEALVSGGVLAE